MTGTELTARRVALGRELQRLGRQIEIGIAPYTAMISLEGLKQRIEVCLAEIVTAPRRCTCQLSYGPAESIPDELHDDDCERREAEEAEQEKEGRAAFQQGQQEAREDHEIWLREQEE